MTNYAIVSDSSCDLPIEIVTSNNLQIVPFSISFNDNDYLREGIDITPLQFFERLKSLDTIPKTSLPSIQTYLEVFEENLSKGLDVLCICLSAKFSGSYQSAVNASNIALENYPNNKVVVINSETVTGGQALMVLEAVRLRSIDTSIDDSATFLNDMRKNIDIIFTIDNLDNLVKGGRVGKAKASVATMLDVKPVMLVEDGEIQPFKNVRRRKKALDYIIEYTLDFIKTCPNGYKIAIYTCVFNDDYNYLLDTLTQSIGSDKDILLPKGQIGVTIGTHTGETTIGICMYKQ